MLYYLCISFKVLEKVKIYKKEWINNYKKEELNKKLMGYEEGKVIFFL